ncbi:MAG: V-type ATP synthase subunit I [Chlamydiota bacterium]
MITKVQKYLILGVKEDLDLFYERAQSQGFIEFISERKSLKHLPESIQTIISSIKILKTLLIKEQSEKLLTSEEASTLAARTLELRDKIDRSQEEKRVWEVEKARIAPYGDFSLEDLKYIEEKGHCKIQLFSAKSGRAADLLMNEDLIYVGMENDLDYFIAINPRIKNYPMLAEMRFEHSLGDVMAKISSIVDSVHSMEKELRQIGCYLNAFKEELVSRLNSYFLEKAKEDARAPLADSSVFSVEAWIPDSKVNGMMPLLEGLAVYCEKVAIEEEDRIPTAMENTGLARSGEDLVRFYDIPSITDKDPSGWVFWSFALFFAIIISDAGYGLVFLMMAVYLKWKWKTFHGSGKRLFRLFLTLSTAIVIWGVVTSSFFGIDLKSNNPLKKIAPFTYLVEKKAEYHMQQKDDVYQEYVGFSPSAGTAKTAQEFLEASPAAGKEFADNILLDLTLIIGIVHISCGLLRYVRRNLTGIGWVCFLVGSYLFFPKMINATTLANFLGLIDKTSANILGEQLIYGGFGLAVLLALVQRGWKGILEVMNVIQISADVLSYLRLYALALASSIMAATFNDMGETVGIFGGFLVILAGHLTNISLGVMSGTIHGLRLNFIEWYRYSFEGGGRLFNPLRILRSKEE